MEKTNKISRIVFLVHGFRGSPETFRHVTDLAREIYPEEAGNLVVCKQWPHGRIFSRWRAAEIVSEIIKEIDDLHDRYDFDELILAGHSSGAAFLRRAYLEATDLAFNTDIPHQSGNLEKRDVPAAHEGQRGELELCKTTKRGWAAKVSRIVLISGIGRGWSLEDASGLLSRISWRLGAILGMLAPMDSTFTIFDLRKGSPFISQMRLRWLQMRQHLKDPVEVFQIVGSIDGTVGPIDSVDQIGDSMVKYTLVQLPETNHKQSIFLDPNSGSSDQRRRAKSRREILGEVFKGELKPQTVDDFVIKKQHLTDYKHAEPDESVTDAVFVIHGIRDHGFWTRKIAAKIKSLADNRTGEGTPTKVVSFTESYGYFAMLPFILWWIRRRKVEWLMDQYVEVRARFPAAKFHYVGHSNGTYLCAAALRGYPMARYDHIMFAGSVVRQDYPWHDMFQTGKAGKVLNLIATKDLVVAWFPNAFRLKFLDLFDLGGAGHTGFDNPENDPQMHQVVRNKRQYYVEGGHSAGRNEFQWEEIANFIMNGTGPDPDDETLRDVQPIWMKLLGFWAPLSLTTIIAIVVGAGIWLAGPLIGSSNAPDQNNSIISHALVSYLTTAGLVLPAIGLCYALSGFLKGFTGWVMSGILLFGLWRFISLVASREEASGILTGYWGSAPEGLIVVAIIAYFWIVRTVVLKL